MDTINDKDSIHLGGTARSPEDVRALHKLGLQFAEIPMTDPDKVSALKKTYRDLSQQTGLYYLCHGPREGDPNDTELLETSYFPKLLRVIEIMPYLDMRLLTIHLWMDPRFVKPEAIAYKMGFLNRLLDYGRETGVEICLENLSETATHLSQIFELLPRLNLTLDIGHAQLLSSRNTSHGFIERFPEKIRHVHIHDNRGGDSPLDDLHLPVGKGIIDFGRMFRKLKAIGYHRTFTLELRPEQIKTCLSSVKNLLIMA